MKTAIPQFLILVLIVWFGSLQSTHGVNPPPDGGYPLGNTAEGEDALFNLTANGAANTAIGSHALFHTTTGDDNSAVGFFALNFNTNWKQKRGHRVPCALFQLNRPCKHGHWF